jgi:formylglycine-generating enzyme required for sulfatase activity
VDVYKTTKLVLKRLEAGTFKMQGSSNVTLTKPFFCGLFEVTQRQYELVTGANPCSSTSYGKGNTYPVHYVRYGMIRGSSNGAKWPSSSAVDSSSFMGKLRSCTGLDFDLPTEAQWEYACRAGTTTTYSYGNSANGNYMWYSSNSSSKTHPVGSKSANPWGLYDMHGNVWEWVQDRHGDYNADAVVDPQGPYMGWCRVIRGGSWDNNAGGCRLANRDPYAPANRYCNIGFRLVLSPGY